MLTDEEKEAIGRELATVPDRRAACIEALRTVQAHRGYVSDESLRDIAQLLGMSIADLEGVASFYNLVFRHPVGRHVIFVCDSVSCWIMDGQSIQSKLGERLGVRLGETTKDGRFTLLPIQCLGACDHAPALMIDQDLHQDLAPEHLEAILERYP